MRTELSGQVVQQFRMRGRFSLSAKVVGSCHQATAKMILPDPIHHHARGKRIVRSQNPLCQLFAAAGIVIGRKFMSPKNRQEAARNHIAGTSRITPQLDRYIFRRLGIGHSIGGFNKRRQIQMCLRQFLRGF